MDLMGHKPTRSQAFVIHYKIEDITLNEIKISDQFSYYQVSHFYL